MVFFVIDKTKANSKRDNTMLNETAPRQWKLVIIKTTNC